jgi:hypothetical protein
VATKKLREAKKLERKTPLSVSEFSVVKYADKSSPVVGSGTTAPTPNEWGGQIKKQMQQRRVVQ